MIQKLEAFVLSRKPLGELDHRLALLTESGQKIEVIAKGTQGATSKRKAHLEPMNRVTVDVRSYRGKNILHSIETISSFQNLKKDYEALLFCFQVLEILNQMLPIEQEHTEIYGLLKNLLQEIEEEGLNEQNQILILTQLAHQFGLLPSFKHCGLCHQEMLTDCAQWDLESKSLLCLSCVKPDVGNYELLELKYRKALEFLRNCTPGAQRALRLESQEVQVLQSLVSHLLGR